MNESDNKPVISGEAYTGTTIDLSKLFSDRDLSGEYDEAKCNKITLSDEGCTTDSKNVTIDGSTVTITGEGDYILNGALRDGMIIVDVDKSEKVQLVLNGVDICSKTSAAIYVKKADKVFVTLADGTENTLANGGTFEAIDDNNIDAVIFSKDDLTLNGTGTLVINSSAAHGIVSKNELVITNGTYQITAASHGMTGKDNVSIADGSF
ncbi:MAG: carbohydrate-binding domain-containing protein, partial [Lachnospiraceae bacterium]|nr:carbohydrate-binding domain-containing protein [Lachnospiraceae bacterium]